MLNIRLLGGAAIEGPDGPVTGRVVQRARLALLALLAASARNRSVPRERLMAMVWPDCDADRARHLLRDSLYRLREALGDETLPGAGDEIRLEASRVRCDVWAFEDAAARGDFAEADRLYTGPFLDGFFLSESPDFEHWIDGERRRLASIHADCLEHLAAQRGEEGNQTDAVRLLQRLAATDPYNARFTILLMQSLDAAGDRAGALRQAAGHAALLKADFDTEPDPDVEALAAQLRREPVAGRWLPAEPARGADPLPEGAGAIATEPDEDPLPGKRLRPRLRATGGLAVALVTLIIAATWYGSRRSETPLDPNVVAVVPFRVAAADSSSNYLREGVMDLAAMVLTGEGVPRAMDPRAVLAAYDRAGGRPGAELTTAQSVTVARGLGAGLLLTGEMVITPERIHMSARLLGVPSGRVIAEHAEQGTGDGLQLSRRLVAGLLAKSLGEGASRLSGLSDSVEALRSYLVGIHTYRGTQPWTSFGHFDRAMEIDPAFATAALWRAFLAGEAYIFGDPERHRIDSVAWSLRGRLSRRDSLVLVALPSIGPAFPGPSTAREKIEAMERAAAANPDRVEVWDGLATILQTFGSQAQVDAPLERAVVAAERALALDPNFLSVLSLRTYLALLQGDTAGIRRYSERFFSGLGDTTLALHWRWAVARALGNSARLPILLAGVAERPGFAWQNIELWSTVHGLASIQDAEAVAFRRLTSDRSGPDDRNAALRSLFRIAAVRGRAREAVALADSQFGAPRPASPSMNHPPGAHAWEDLSRHAFITLGILGPGYEDAAREAVRHAETHADTTHDAAAAANDLCYAQLWRATRHDTSGTRAAIARMRRLARTIDPAPGWRVTTLDLCPQLLEAVLEWRDDAPPARTPALDRVDALLRAGPQAEVPGNLARLIVARWRELQGRYGDALAVVRGRDPMAWTVTAPAAWLAEGQLAALAGDTAGAVRAYSRYLALRDQPDPGPIAGEREWVRARLAELVSTR